MIHSKNYLHREIRPDKVYMMTLGETLVPKLSYLSLARHAESQLMTSSILEGEDHDYRKGPDDLKEGVYSEATDIWALGVILYEMLARSHPFENIGSV